MKAPVFLAMSLLVGATILHPPPLDAAQSQKPNLLVFLSDDVGWAEYGFQGNKEIPTPNIDSLAKSGVRFTQGYVSGPYCSPTRAGLMTGRYQTRFGHEFNGGGGRGSNFGLPLKEQTIADRFKALGYVTACVGKWHLGGDPQFLPMKRGFNEFYGTVANTPFFNPPNFVDSRVSPEVNPLSDPNFYTTDAYAARAADWLERNKDKPWFLYLPFNAQHAPLQATPKYLDRFPDIQDERRKTFAAMMSAMDDAVGAVVKKVRALDQEENTLIFFLSDNGGPTRSTTSKNEPLRGFKATTWEGGVRVPFCFQWKGHVPAGKVYDHPIIQLDILPTALAAAGVTPDPAWKLDGVNLLPYLTGKSTGKPHETLYWRFGDQWAIRHGDYKLVRGRDGGDKAWLVHLEKDISESNDLSSTEADKASQLKALWEKWNDEQSAPLWQPANPAQKKAKKKGKQRQ